VSRAWLFVLAGAFLAVGTPNEVRAFCRATTSSEGTCGEFGEPLWWATPCLSYAIDERGSQSLDPEETRAAVDAGFDAWANVICATGHTDIQFLALSDATCMTPEYNQRGGNVNAVIFLDPWEPPTSEITLDPRALALTVMWIDTDSGEIFDADMLINDEQPLAHCTTDGPCTGYDLQSIVTHEAGHFIGIGHSPLRDATMYFEGGAPGSIGMRTLAQDDIDATCTIYPPGSLQSDCSGSDFTPRGGLDLTCEDGTKANSGGGGCSAVKGGTSARTSIWTLGLGLFVCLRRRWSYSALQRVLSRVCRERSR